MKQPWEAYVESEEERKPVRLLWDGSCSVAACRSWFLVVSFEGDLQPMTHIWYLKHPKTWLTCYNEKTSYLDVKNQIRAVNGS